MSALNAEHRFVRPGQVAPDRPARDACMECGQPRADHDRAGVIAGLRELADFLEAHPGLPLHDRYELCTHTRGDSDEAERAQVDAAAVMLDATPRDNGNGHYSAGRTFAGISYRILAITRDHMAEYDARNSYSDVIQVTA
jgi:hypothetical protein